MGSDPQPGEFLRRIVEAKRAELGSSRARVPQEQLETRIQPRSPGLFRTALTAQGPASDCAVIAEVKKASPSCGVLCADFHPDIIARGYRDAGARALSVLTDSQFFQGSISDLQAAKAASGLPVLRKDFTLDEYHVYEAAAAEADAVLLIVAILPVQTLRHLIQLSRTLGLDALVEVHTADELRTAVDAGAEIIGVNNRDLKTFEVSLDTSLRLIETIPDEALAISESGLRSADDLERLRAAGFDAFLIGERFMTEKYPGAALSVLLSEVASRATRKGTPSGVPVGCENE
ncbi:MAG: indole-3-glycerol phosphate synthase TrpC [Acidobacteria bacterium]|nr:indole-3-glycerol phosphate synthase TrpC [Acidobacteriota bacterium]